MRSSLRRFVRSHAASLMAIGLLLAGVHSARAQTVMVSNLDETPLGYGGPNYNSVPFVNNLVIAQSFTTGASDSLLDSIMLSLNVGTGDGFSLALYSNSDGTPGTLIETLSGSATPTAVGDYSYTSGSSTLLEAGTTYWWVASIVDPSGSVSSFHINTTSTAETSSSDWTIGDQYAEAGSPDGPWNISNSVFQFSVSATAVPEPVTCAALAGAAALAFVAYRRRRT